MSGSVRDRDRGAKALMKRLGAGKPQKPTTVSIGILEAEGAESHGDGATVAEVASFHEFGLGVPERSFLRAWADENEEANKERLRKIALAVEQGKLPSVEQGLERFGLFAVGSIQQRIAAGIEPELAPSTVARKGSSTPLIDTGVLRASITHKVEK